MNNRLTSHQQRMARYQVQPPATLKYRKDVAREYSTVDLQELYYDILAVFTKHIHGVSLQERAEFASVVRALVTCYLEETNDGKSPRVLDDRVHHHIVAKLSREELCRLVGVYMPEEGEGSVEAHNTKLRERQQLADAAYIECRAKHPGMTIDMTNLNTAESLLQSLGFLAVSRTTTEDSDEQGRTTASS